MATARPCVSVYDAQKPDADAPAKKSLCLPQVFSAPLRADLVRTVFTNMNKNKRQAYALKFESGYDTAAASWGTGRAVARIPRVPGGGTHRSGQGAFGNMCRGGGMFNPTKTWRKWHHKTNIAQKRHALAAAIAATAVPALVMARGHRVDEVPELPLVVTDNAGQIQKTREALALLKALGGAADLQRVKDSKKIHAGRGKTRNRRYVMRKGPIVVHNCSSAEMKEGSCLTKAMRNLPGVDVAHVDRLNLLQMAPGGTIGRFALYTEGAIKRLAQLFGTKKTGSAEKKGFTLGKACMQNTDIARIINSTEVQAVVRPAVAPKNALKEKVRRSNALKSSKQLANLCPWKATEKKRGRLAHVKGSNVQKAIAGKVKKGQAARKAHGKKNKTFYKSIVEAHSTKPVAAEEAAAEE